MNTATDPIAFLNRMLAEDERVARAATPGPWHALDGGVVNDDEDQWPVAQTESSRDREDRMHIARHDPARVLRRVEADRRRLARHSPTQQPGPDSNLDDPSTWCTCCSTCQATIIRDGDWLCEELRDMLSEYQGCPGFDPAWLED